jgi:hypothetical protein
MISQLNAEIKEAKKARNQTKVNRLVAKKLELMKKANNTPPTLNQLNAEIQEAKKARNQNKVNRLVAKKLELMKKTVSKNSIPSKFRNAVNRAIVNHAIKMYVSKMKSKFYPSQFLQKSLIEYMKKNPITINQPLYRGVTKNAAHMPPTGGVYNSVKRFSSFSKTKLKAAAFGGNVYMLPPGTYPAINIHAYAKKFPVAQVPIFMFGHSTNNTNKIKYPYANKETLNFLGYGTTEHEVLFPPGKWQVGNRRPNLNHGVITVRNIKFLGPT